MTLFTKSNQKDWNRVVYLKILEGEEAIKNLNDKETCKIVLILKGNGAINSNNCMHHVIAPALVCINQESQMSLEDFRVFQLRVLYFKPIALNDHLAYDVFNEQYYNKMSGTTIFQDLTLLSAFYGIKSKKRVLRLVEPPFSIILNQLFEKIKIELCDQKDNYWPCRSRSYFIELLFFMDSMWSDEMNEAIQENNHRISSKFICDIIQYLNQNIDQKVTLEMIEKKFACNRNQINREFQRELNTTVMKYLVWMRMQLASTILRDTEVPLAEVALRVGYSDVSYFSRTVKTHFGKTPRELQCHH